LVTIFTYLALWLIVPKATFLPTIVDHLSRAASHTSGVGRVWLALIAFVLMGLSTVLFMAIQIGIAYSFARIRLDFKRSILAFMAFLACAFLMMMLIVWQFKSANNVHQPLGFQVQLLIVSRYITILTMPYYLCIMLASISLGYLVSIRVKDKNLLLPVVMFAAYIDFWTVTRGPVATVLQRAPEVVNAVSTPIPHAGKGAFVPATMIGPGDFIFMALVFAAVHRFAMRPSRNYWFVFGAMTLGMLAVGFGLLNTLPALIVLAVAIVTANWREFKLSREEKISTLVVGVLLLASLPLVWSLFKPAPSGEHKAKPKHAVTSTNKANVRTVP